MQQDPLYKVLDAVPYQTRLINGVQSLWELQKKLVALKIPELDLPSVSDTVIKARLNDLYKVQDDLFIHLHGGPLVRNTHRLPIGDKKKREIDRLLDQVAKEIGLYEEFVKRDDYLSLESILNESDSSDEYEDSEIYEAESSVTQYDTPSVSSTKAAPVSSTSAYDRSLGSPPSRKKSSTLRRVTSQPTITNTIPTSLSPLIANSSHSLRRFDSSSAAGSTHSYDAISDPSLSQLLANDDDQDEKLGDMSSESFKWTPLVKISDHLYSKDVRQTSGLVSVMAVSGVIAVGTTRSLVYVYDYSQNLKCILGDTIRAVEVGAVTSLAISADHTTIVCGHSQGHLVVWDIRKPLQPVRSIEPILPSQTISNGATNITSSSPNPTASSSTTTQAGSRKEGHVKGAAILHVGFIGIKKTEIVSGDDQGMAFYHVLYKVVMVNAVDTTRILGRYQNLSLPSLPSSPSSSSSTTAAPTPTRMGSSASLLDPTTSSTSTSPKPRRPSTVFAMQALPLGQLAHPAENYGLVALLTPYKMIIVGLKPSCQTKFKILKPKLSQGHLMDGVSSVPGPNIDQQQGGKYQHSETYHENISGCLAWLPVTKATGSFTASKDATGKDKWLPKESLPFEDPMLAYAWGNHLFILRVGVSMVESQRSPGRFRTPMNVGGKNKRGTKLHFPKPAECQLDDVIIGLQWINRQILVIFTPNEEMLLFDPKKMVVTERATIRNKQLVYHDWFNGPLRDLTATTTTTLGVLPGSNELDMTSATSATMTTTKAVEMAYYHSLKGYKGKLFLLGLNQIYVGTLLSWADRILSLVRAGDFLDAIQLSTAFYNGKWTQTVIGLPADEQQRKQLVGEKLMELLVASLNYAFSSTRQSILMEEQQVQQRNKATTTSVNGGVDVIRDLMPDITDTVDNPVLYPDLAKCCVDACLSINDQDFLFETAYEQFAEHGVHGLFLQVLENYIVSDQLRDIPPAIMKDLVTHYSTHGRLTALERVIWHVNPQCLDIDQVVGVCQREGLYEAMMYVWNRSMDDFVSPLVEMLKVIRHSLKLSDEAISDRTHWDNNLSASMTQQQQQRIQAEKVFEYLKMVLQGRTFPEGALMPNSRGNEARSAVYSFVFSGRCVVWPRVGGKLILTVDESETTAEPTYPYLRLLLRFNTKKFLEALEVAFEDPWLNGGDDMLTSTFEEDVLQGKVISRQIIVNTLLDVMGGGGISMATTNNSNSNSHLLSTPRLHPSFSASTVHSGVGSGSGTNKGSGTSSDTASSYYDGDNSRGNSQNDHLLQLYIFIASNLPKYTTFILLPLTTKQKILLRLTVNDMTGYQPHHHHHHRYEDDETKEERQRAVQQLLTVYTPNNEEAMTTLYEEARFWNVLEDVYRRDKKYGKLVETYLKDTTSPTAASHRRFTSDLDNNSADEEQDEETATLARQLRVFHCVDSLLDESSTLTEHQRQDVKRVVQIRISQFVDMDGQRTADLIQKYFDADHHDILRRLDEDEEFEDDEDEENEENDRGGNDGQGDVNDPSSLLSSRFPVTFARVADKRTFSYLRGLLEPQAIATSGPTGLETGHSSSDDQHGTAMMNEDGYIILDEYGSVLEDGKNTTAAITTTTIPRRTNIDIALQERYIDLMCRFDPSGVYDYLNTKLYDYDHNYQHNNNMTTTTTTAAAEPGAITHTNGHGLDDDDHDDNDGFQHVNFDTLLKSCEKYGVMDAAVWIMEKIGNIKGALEKMLEVGKEKVQMILFIIKQQQQQQPWMFEDQSKISNGLIGLSGVLRVGTRLCENSSSNPNADSSSDGDDEIESLWFRLLDVYVEASMEIHSALDIKKNPNLVLPLGVQQHVIYTFKSFVQSILTSLLLSTSPQVSLPRLLLRLIDSQTKGETTFADFRDIFLSMLDTYKYEGQLLALTNRLFDRDLFLGVQDMVRQRGKGWRPQAMICAICSVGVLDMSLMQAKLWNETTLGNGTETQVNHGVDENFGKVMVFHCGHVYHRQCLDSQHQGDTGTHGRNQCILCLPLPPPTASLSASTAASALDKGKSRAGTISS
ncbi:unnamed protein product [Absidia cylindrospora]